jgi:hypothetical protein
MVYATSLGLIKMRPGTLVTQLSDKVRPRIEGLDEMRADAPQKGSQQQP